MCNASYGSHKRLLDLGFAQTLQNIIQRLPKQRRTGLFSATMTDALTSWIKAGLRNPVRVVVKIEDKDTKQVQRIPSSLSVSYLIAQSHEKIHHLLHTIQSQPNLKFIVYFATCHCVDYFHKVTPSVMNFSVCIQFRIS